MNRKRELTAVSDLLLGRHRLLARGPVVSLSCGLELLKMYQQLDEEGAEKGTNEVICSCGRSVPAHLRTPPDQDSPA